MTIFNRKLLFQTFSLKIQAQIREALNANGIEYKIKTRSMSGPALFSSRHANTGTFGMNMDCNYEYLIYVHKDDFEKAEYLLNKDRSILR